ncbi:hypothetical protein [Falsiroseomonas oryzae]|uniref:hypothetical protein n=1 Tax=Falsiroseomonas oryzae TaxID=2766473 RepID=UPI0022EB24A3|nr:hypothetical protein [Roseomonas sp. MO-31]
MPSAINQQDFADPISRRLARGESLGESSQIWLDPWGRSTVPIVNGGMVDPEPYEIAAGTTLYRFASAGDGVEGALRGGWWLERRQLDHLIRYSQVNGRTLGYAVRLLCCVPPEWGSALNFLVAVKAAGTLMAWRGLANSAVGVFSPPAGMPAAAAGTTRITARNDVAALRVPQLFIPGTRRPGAASALFRYEGQWQTEGARDWVFGSGQ